MRPRHGCPCGCATLSELTGRSWTGGDALCVNAGAHAPTGATTPWAPAPRSPVPTTPSARPVSIETPTGDTFHDLVMVLAIGGSIGLILAIEFCVFCFWLAAIR